MSTLTVYSDGAEMWWLDDKLHRINGPAVTFSDGTKMWYLNGQLDRIDGPAFTRPDGDEEWYLDGIKISPEFGRKVSEFYHRVQKRKSDRIREMVKERWLRWAYYDPKNPRVQERLKIELARLLA